jgi:Putative transposase
MFSWLMGGVGTPESRWKQFGFKWKELLTHKRSVTPPGHFLRRCQRFADSLRKGAGFRIEKALAQATRKAINEVLARDHPEIFVRIERTVRQKPWVAHARACRTRAHSLRYLAAYVKKSTFSEGRPLDYDQSGTHRAKLSRQRRWKA